MPRAQPDRAVSERWLTELEHLLVAGPTRRQRAIGRLAPRPHTRRQDDLLLAAGIAFTLVSMRPTFATHRPAEPDHVELALYPLGATAGSLPDVIVAVPLDGVLEPIAEQGGEVDVRGVLEPGHGVVLVLDDGRTVGCLGPTRPPPPVFARHLWGLPASP